MGSEVYLKEFYPTSMGWAKELEPSPAFRRLNYLIHSQMLIIEYWSIDSKDLDNSINSGIIILWLI